MADFTTYSRFRRDTPIIVNGVETLGRWRQPSWLRRRPDESSVHKYKVPSRCEGRPHLIAEELYGVSELDWVLIAFNGVRQPFGWPRTGTVLEYPDESIVFPEL